MKVFLNRKPGALAPLDLQPETFSCIMQSYNPWAVQNIHNVYRGSEFVMKKKNLLESFRSVPYNFIDFKSVKFPEP